MVWVYCVMATKFKCCVCGKVSSGRLPKDGDTSFRYPRRHKINGVNCKGNILEAYWIEIDAKQSYH